MKANRILSFVLALVMTVGTLIAGTAVSAEESLYKDVKTSRWSYEDIKYVTEEGLMTGTGNGKFSPAEAMTRAMVVTVLYRLQGSPEVDYTGIFTDVKKGTWYTDAVIWASRNGIVNGIGDGKFAPMKAVTREELAAIIMRYAPQECIDTEERADITVYSDYGRVHDYAKDALSWANAIGLITGVTKTTLEPRGTATREQVAASLRRFIEFDGYKYLLAYNEPTVFTTYTEKEYPLVTDADIYVAVDGNDANSGSIDAPIASFARAKEMVREKKATATEEIKVAFKAGNYGSLENLTFTAEDSGTAEVPITYCAYGDGDVIFLNGNILPSSAFKPIEDDDKYLFKEENFDSIYKIDLSEILPEGEEITTLFSGSGICHEARYPNKNEDGTDAYYRNMTTTVDKYCSIQLQAFLPRIVESFRTVEGMKVTGFLRVGWLVETFNVKSYDPETKIVTFDTYEGYVPASGYPIGESKGGFDFMYEGRTDDTVFFSNLSDQLDNEGEYWFDPATRVLYVYKPNGDYTITTGGQFLNMTSADNISFVGLTFNGSVADNAIDIYDCQDMTIDRCTFCNMAGSHVMRVRMSRNFKLINSELYCFGATGLFIEPFWKDKDGDFENSYFALKPSGVVIDNNYFHDFGFIDMWSEAVNIIRSMEAQISHNLFERGAHGAVRYDRCNNIVIEYNVFDRMMMTTGDYGAVYTNTDFATRGNIVRYNLFKNNRIYSIYLDGDSNGTEIYGNLIYNNKGECGVTINGGRDHNIHDNVFIAYKGSGRFLFSNLNPTTEAYLEGDRSYVPGSLGEMKTLARLPQPGEVGYEEWASRWPLLYQYNDDFSKLGEVECIFTTINYITDNYQIGDQPIGERAYLLYGVGQDTNKVLTLEENPFFVDPTHGDYRIREDSDFVLPVEQMGRY